MSRIALSPLLAAVLFVGYIACLYIYRLTLHPLARYPGPKLAAVTRWYEFYFDVVRRGQYVFQVHEMHKKYGPIIRISPEELHIDDPDFWDTLYARSGRLHKLDRDSERFGNPYNTFATANAEIHRVRRAALNPFFSRRNVIAFQPFVQETVDKMLDGIKQFKGTNQPLTISFAYMALAGDVIMEYCYGYNFKHIESPGFSTNFHELMVTASETGNLALHLPSVTRMIMSMPEWFVVWGTPLFALLFKFAKSVEQNVKENRRRENAGELDDYKGRPNLIQHLMRSDLPAKEKTDRRIQDEAQNFVGAGATTTGWALCLATYHIIKERRVFTRLRKELEQAIPDPNASESLEITKLEQCEYLTACIKEGIRLSYGVSSRSSRLSDDVIQYKSWQIPPRTAISMTLVDLHNNEDIFPESRKFKPERWLEGGQTQRGDPVDKYWFAFHRGNRSCVGVNLAWLELYMALAGVFRNFDFELFETDDSDVELKHDFLVPSPKLDSKGIRVLVR